jgi:uncharacterized protein YlxW (UPF0749 family)
MSGHEHRSAYHRPASTPPPSDGADVELVRNARTGEFVQRDVSARAARWRLKHALWPRYGRSQIAAALVLGLLGFMAAVQVHSRHTENDYVTASRPQLIQILDGLSERSSRLRSGIANLEQQKRKLRSGADRNRTATEQARVRARTLGILAGTVPATGPGVQVYIEDASDQVTASLILNTIQELRDAGAEAIEINNTARVTASTAFLDTSGGIEADGHKLVSPYAIEAIGPPSTMATAMRIPGGVEDEVKQRGGSVSVQQLNRVDITSVRRQTTPKYALPPQEGP